MRIFLPRSLLAVLVAGLSLITTVPAQAAVTITFWSHDFGNNFPHAFVTLRGVPDAGGELVDTAYGFTAITVSPALLFGNVGGMVEVPKTAYIGDSDAQFSLVLTDAQYAQELALAQAWGGKAASGTAVAKHADTRYNLNRRNCVHFVKEAARIAGLVGLDQPKLMKKPRSYLLAVGAANASAVTTVTMKGDAYLASLPPLGPPMPRPAPDLHVAPPSRIDQPAGKISMTSKVEAKAG